ncbi:MAG: hypothetical protein IT536_08195 [Hyphomicrobiales bacterium]|nr:hypothetical protein [Hyphomicrobiales bacterium]
MYTQHPTLLIGPSDWDEAHSPRAEFEHRIAALWAAFPDTAQAIVFGSAASHAELAYLTHFVPKLEPAVALLQRDGRHRLLFGGGPNMIGAMRPLTFITEMAPLSARPKVIAGWRGPLLIGTGAMTRAMRTAIDNAVGGTAQDATTALHPMMGRKSPSELAAIRAACRGLAAAAAAMRHALDRGATDALLAGERAALDAGAQDIRTLISLDQGRTLRPFEGRHDRAVRPLLVYAAVRRFNYWAEGFDCIGTPAAASAAARLSDAIAAVAPGVSLASLADRLAPVTPNRDHPVTAAARVAAIGLSLDEPSPAVCETGTVLSLRAGSSDGRARHAILSAMVAVGEGGAEVLWRSGIA